MPAELGRKIEQVVRLIRSKGVGVYFVTQNPLDVPDAVLGQLGNRVQHALRAFTPRDQKAVKAAAQTFRANPGLDVEEAITELAVGEALVSFLDEKGTPRPVERALVLPPASRLAPLTAEERAAVQAASPLRGRYDQLVDRESAYEKLGQRASSARAGEGEGQAPAGKQGGGWSAGPVASEVGSVMAEVAKRAAKAAGTQLGREIMRGVLGSLFRRR